jgi:hypothetical protein
LHENYREFALFPNNWVCQAVDPFRLSVNIRVL